MAWLSSFGKWRLTSLPRVGGVSRGPDWGRKSGGKISESEAVNEPAATAIDAFPNVTSSKAPNSPRHRALPGHPINALAGRWLTVASLTAHLRARDKYVNFLAARLE